MSQLRTSSVPSHKSCISYCDFNRFVPFSTQLLLALLLVTCCSCFQAANAANQVESPPQKNTATHGISVVSGTMRVQVQAISNSVIRVQANVNSKVLPETEFVIERECSNGADFEPRIEDKSDEVVLQTNALTVRVNKSPLQIIIEDKDHNVITSDTLERPMAFSGSGFQIWKDSPLDEHYFGLGDKTGPLDRRDLAFTCWNIDPALFQESTDPIYKSFPFILAMRNKNAYGIFLNNSYRSFFDFGKSARQSYSFGAEGGPLDYYFFYGPHPKKVIESFTALTGRMNLPPLFSLGYQQSRGSYIPDTAVRAVAAELRKKKIPCDVIYLDGDYKDSRKSFAVNTKLFPDFPKLISDLSKQGFQTVTSMDPYIIKTLGEPAYDDGHAAGYFLKMPDGDEFVGKVWPEQCVWPDFARQDVRNWWAELHKDFLNAGVRGFWDDMNEPAVFNRLDKTLPLQLVHDVNGRKTDERELHNLFGLLNTKATYDAAIKFKPSQRPFILTRSGFAGSQRYAATWTGDNTSTWNHMRLSVTQLLNLGVSGMTFSGADIGGFNGFSHGPSAELLTRWMQLGAFNPLYRNHCDFSATRAREPWVDGPEHEQIRKRYIEERYRLLPYIYSCMEDASRTGIPLMRPMFLEFPNEQSLVSNSEQYMFGDSLLVAPKLWDISRGYPVQLPVGTWFDYWSGEKIAGGKTITVDPKLSELPVYVRAGSIIPMQSVVQNVNEKSDKPLELRMYAGTTHGAGSVYCDAGDTFAYTKGSCVRRQFKFDLTPDTLILTTKSDSSWTPKYKSFQISIFGLPNSVTTITLNGVRIKGWKKDGSVVTLPIVPWVSQSRNNSSIIY